MDKGNCLLKKKFFGIVTITDRGQIAIPKELRRALQLNNGEKLIIIKRKDNKGFNLIKSDTIDEFLDNLSEN